jgi:pilus assembly protein CpaB
MNRARLLMIGALALALGAFVSFFIYRTLQAKTGGGNEPSVEVMVASREIQVGSKLEDADLRLAKFSRASVPNGAYLSKTKLLGRGVIQPITAGEFILPSKLAAENAGAGLPAMIPPGMRAVTVRVNDVTAVAGFATPGTRVDVLLTGNPSGSNEKQTTTVLENVAVLATGQKLERNSAGEAQNAPVITLLVSPDDAQKLTLASSEGRIQLSLRNPLDTRDQSLSAVREQTLYRGGAASSPPPSPVKVPRKPSTNVIPPPKPASFSVEIIKGDKRENKTFDEGSGPDK